MTTTDNLQNQRATSLPPEQQQSLQVLVSKPHNKNATYHESNNNHIKFLSPKLTTKRLIIIIIIATPTSLAV
jgi:hypothetical protein